MTETTDLSMNSFDKAADIEMQNFSDPLVEEAPNKTQLKLTKVETLKKTIETLLIYMLVIFAIFSSGFSLYNMITAVHNGTTCLTIYIEDITNIASLSPENKLLHESRYNTLFNDPNRHMVNFDKLPKLYGKRPYIESYNYFRNYSYILQHPKLSLYIKLTTLREDDTSFATLIDRSVTSKPVEEIYDEYKFYDLNTFYQLLQYQQPVHRMTPMSSLWQPKTPTEYGKINEYFWFLTDFIVLCNPLFYNEGNTTSNTLISRENVHELLIQTDTLNDKFFLPEIVLSFMFCFFPLFAFMMLADFCKSERRWLQVSGNLLFVFSIIHCIMAALAMKLSGMSEMGELITSLFGSQSVNVQIPEMEKVPKILTYHTVELVISFVLLLLLTIFSRFITS